MLKRLKEQRDMSLNEVRWRWWWWWWWAVCGGPPGFSNADAAPVPHLATKHHAILMPCPAASCLLCVGAADGGD